MTGEFMTRKEVRDIMDKLKDTYKIKLITRVNNSRSCGNTEAYDYVYSDDMGNTIEINPISKTFVFRHLFKLVYLMSSPECGSFDNYDFFINNYLEFRHFGSEVISVEDN